jgi:hypothetical protein
MNAKTLFLVLLLVGMVGYGGYYWGTRGKAPQAPQENQVVTETTPTNTPEPTPDEKAALTLAIRQGLVAEHGGAADRFNITVSKIEGVYARGGVTETSAVGGAMWLSVKVNGSWRLVWDGNGTISCDLIVTYPEFPKTMVPECWNEKTSKNVVR